MYIVNESSTARRWKRPSSFADGYIKIAIKSRLFWI